jgi:hypothetical protein
MRGPVAQPGRVPDFYPAKKSGCLGFESRRARFLYGLLILLIDKLNLVVTEEFSRLQIKLRTLRFLFYYSLDNAVKVSEYLLGDLRGAADCQRFDSIMS